MFKKELEKAAEILQHCGLVATAGNGGSCANAIHMVADLRDCAITAIDLCNPCVLTAIANDCKVKDIFSIQVADLLTGEEDVLILFSGSGESPNILEAARMAVLQGVAVISFSRKGASLEKDSTVYFGVEGSPENWMQELENEHAVLAHKLVNYINRIELSDTYIPFGGGKMSKQEEIWEEIGKIVFGKIAELKEKGITGAIARDILRYLHSQGVVIKTDRKFSLFTKKGYVAIDGWIMERMRRLKIPRVTNHQVAKLLEMFMNEQVYDAGYTAWEPLIKEEK